MSGKQAPSAAARHAVDTLDQAVKGAKAYERDDLVTRLSGARRLLTDSSVTVHVVGEFKQGKSSLVNGLLTAPVCPVDDDLATCVPTEVRYSPHVTATATFEPAPGAGGTGWTETIRPGEIAQYASEAGNPDNTRRLTAVTVGIDRPLLSSGLVLVDTPGVGGIGSVHHASMVGNLPQSHAVLFVTDVSQELTAAELRFLQTVQELCPTVVLVLTKIDLYRQWMRIAELDHAHLQRAGVDMEMIAVSSELRSLAAAAEDQALNDESGYPALVGRLGRVVADAEELALDAVVTHVASAVDQMEVTALARRDALVDPDNAAALLERLRETKERADALRERSSKWQVLLQDGFSDIASDVEFDLRQRSRAVLHEAEAALDAGDPAKTWEQFEEWLRERLAGEAMQNYALFVRRAKEVAATVGEHFHLAESEIVTARDVAAPVDVVGALALDGEFTSKKAKGLGAAFQKSYGGVLMFTMLPAIMGLAVPLPVGLVGGALLGSMGYREERKRQLERRRQEAKTAVRRAVDEFNLHVGKDSRDAIRHVQRELRTSWSDRVGELQRSAAAALSAAQTEAKGGESDAAARQRIESDLAILARLRARIDDLRAHLERTRAPADPATAAAGVPA